MVLTEKKLLALIDEAELHQALRDVTSLCERGKPRISWDYSDRHVEGASVDRARVWIVLTTWGGPMSPGSKNGKAYDYLDYDVLFGDHKPAGKPVSLDPAIWRSFQSTMPRHLEAPWPAQLNIPEVGP
ncbi:MAG TPA: hypothetical protein VF550_19815 [Polyangia bacterium]